MCLIPMWRKFETTFTIQRCQGTMLIINHVINGCSTIAYNLEKTLFVMRQIFPATDFFLVYRYFAIPHSLTHMGYPSFSTNPSCELKLKGIIFLVVFNGNQTHNNKFTVNIFYLLLIIIRTNLFV